METVLGRYKNLIVLAAVLFVQILGLAVQVRRTADNESSRLIRVWAVGAVSPFEKVLRWVQTSTGDVWHNYFYLRGVRAENRELKREIERMRLEQVRMSQDADQARRLQALLAFKEQFISRTLAAQVIGASGSEQSRTVYIDKGENDGVKPDMAVITVGGIVGKVLHVYGSTSQVLLINDQTSGVGAILDKSRLQGILRGTAAGEVVLEKVMSDESVPQGEQVLTSGGDRIFPKGLPIGTVTKVSTGSDLFLNIRIRPSANLSKLEEVLVVTKIDEKQIAPDLTGPVRAVDVLAERLPTVPQKAADASAQSPTGTTTPSAAKPGAPGAAVPSNSPASSPANPVAHPAKGTQTPGAAPVNRGEPAKTVTKTSAANPATGKPAVKISQDAGKPPAEPKPQPPAEDHPQ